MARFGLVILLLARPALASSGEDCARSGACCFPRNEPRAVFVSTAAPRLATLASIIVSEGGLGRPVVKRVLSGRTAALGACASTSLRVHLVISPAGTVQQAGATGCVAEALRTTRFPATSGVTEVELRLIW